jgi:hypothetical protein
MESGRKYPLNRRRLLAVVATWIGLFTATVIIAKTVTSEAAVSEETTEDRTVAEFVKAGTRAQLEGQTRKTGPTAPFGAVSFDETQATIHKSLSDEIFKRSDAIMSCTRSSMKYSTLHTQFLEISFVVSRSSCDITGAARVSDVVLERSSLRLSSEEEQCLVREFSQIVAEARDVLPSRRIYYPLCINRRADSYYE